MRLRDSCYHPGLPDRFFVIFLLNFQFIFIATSCTVDPEWASASKGLFICITCSGIHRNLGAQVSVVKSLRLDTWTDEKLKVRLQASSSSLKQAELSRLIDRTCMAQDRRKID